jgi:hypothetical protein
MRYNLPPSISNFGHFLGVIPRTLVKGNGRKRKDGRGKRGLGRHIGGEWYRIREERKGRSYQCYAEEEDWKRRREERKAEKGGVKNKADDLMVLQTKFLNPQLQRLIFPVRLATVGLAQGRLLLPARQSEKLYLLMSTALLERLDSHKDITLGACDKVNLKMLNVT